MKYFKLYEALTEMDHHNMENDARQQKYAEIKYALEQDDFNPAYNEYMLATIVLNNFIADKSTNSYKLFKQILAHPNFDKNDFCQLMWDQSQYPGMTVRELAHSKVQLVQAIRARTLLNFSIMDPEIRKILDNYEKLEDFDVF